MTSIRWLDFDGDQDHVEDTGIYEIIFTNADRDNSTNFADNPRSCWQILMIFEGGGLSHKPFDIGADPGHDPDSGF